MNKISSLKKVAFIPARSGSTRIINKNIKCLGEHPLIAYTIVTAVKSNLFDEVFCFTDDEEYAKIAKYYGAKVPFLRPKEISSETSPDINWVKWAIESLENQEYDFDVFFILRPTSPFRTTNTLIRAWDSFISESNIDSLRAVQKSKTHPGKMWAIQQNRLLPLFPFELNGTPWHSNQNSALPVFYEQNASLEISWLKTIKNSNTISGTNILPFLTEDLEGFDINTKEDWSLAEYYINNNILDSNFLDIKPYKK